jgi:hypothetical protein
MGAPGARSPSARTQRTPLSCPTIPASSPPTTPSPIRRQLDAVAAPVILAQSGAGPLLPASARTLKASHQVWLAAWVPDPQASFVEEFEAHAEVAFNPDWIRKDPVEGRHRRGDVRLPRLRRGDARVGARDAPALPSARRLRRAHLAHGRDPIDVHRRDEGPHGPAPVRGGWRALGPVRGGWRANAWALIHSRSRAAADKTPDSPTPSQKSSSTSPKLNVLAPDATATSSRSARDTCERVVRVMLGSRIPRRSQRTNRKSPGSGFTTRARAMRQPIACPRTPPSRCDRRGRPFQTSPARA